MLTSPIAGANFFAIPRTRLRVSAAARQPNMYELLSVAETAGPEQIKEAYRRQARRWHPDACRADSDKDYFAARFMRAREAYEVLSDPDLRRDYDRAAGVRGEEVFRKGSEEREFGDWGSQLEGLRERRSGAAASRRRDEGEESWGSRMRRAHGWEDSD